MFALIGILGLAIDGGAMFTNRRLAQNSADAASLAATRSMLTAYDRMLINNQGGDVDGTPADEAVISVTLTSYAAAHGIPRANLQAFYVNDDKEVVTNRQVGQYGGVPWTLGAKGIAVANTATSDSFLMQLFGWNKIGATAQSAAFMGITSDSSDISLLPIGLNTQMVDVDNLQLNQDYTLLDGDVTKGSGDWAWLDLNGQGNQAQTLDAWLLCGFNPAVTGPEWPIWCPGAPTVTGYGPTQHHRSTNSGNFDPEDNPTSIPLLIYGAGTDGWWLAGSSATNRPSCSDFRDRVASANGGSGGDFWFPVLDRSTDSAGRTLYHLRMIADFWITPADTSCVPQPDPLHEGKPDLWRVHGTARTTYQGNSTGKHGDLRHTSGHVVFLDN